MASNPQQGMFNKGPPNQKNKPNQKKAPYQNQPKKGPNAHPTKPNNPPKTQQPESMTGSKEKDVLMDLLSNLECFICLEFLNAPIYMCETGHNICGSCRDQLAVPVCHICKMPVTSQRNYALEDICSKVGKPCPNANYGCKFITTDNTVKNHFENCHFRQFFCPLGKTTGSCIWTGSYLDLQKHFNDVHPSNCMLKVGSQVMFPEFEINKADYNMQLVTLGKRLFLYHVTIDTGRGLAYWVIQCIGSEKEAEKWKYQLNIYNSKKQKKVIDITEECFADSVDLATIHKNGTCVAVPLCVLKNYIHENKKFTFKFFIRQIAPQQQPQLANQVANMKIQ